MSNCIKTGFQGYSTEYGCYVMGDAYCVPGTEVYYFRVSEETKTPARPYLHFTINQIENWFDRDAGVVSTIIAKDSAVTLLGYEGIPIEQAKAWGHVK